MGVKLCVVYLYYDVFGIAVCCTDLSALKKTLNVIVLSKVNVGYRYMYRDCFLFSCPEMQFENISAK